MTMRELADKLQCDKSNIYNYIKSKQDLLDMLLFEIADKFHKGISEIESSSYSALDKLKAIIRLHVTMTFENPYKMNIHATEWRFLDEARKKTCTLIYPMAIHMEHHLQQETESHRGRKGDDRLYT